MNADDQLPFLLSTAYKGYRTKEDQTMLLEALGSDAFLASGSRNMLLSTAGSKVVTRRGYTLWGDEDTSGDRIGIDSDHDWLSSTGDEFGLRKVGTELQVYSEETLAWEVVKGDFSASYPVRFAEIWNSTELIDELLMVNHDTSLYEWSGGMGTLAAGGVAAGTITIQETIGEQRFLTSGTRKIRIKDDTGVWRETVYTAQSGSDFTVSTDLTGYTFSTGALVMQSVRENATVIGSGYVVDTIGVLDNQVWLGSHASRVHYVSKNTSFTDYSYSTPRVPGEGVLLTLDDVNIGFAVGRSVEGKEVMNVFCGADFVYETEFVLSSGSTSDREIVKVNPLVAAAGQGARSQELIGKTKDDVVFLNYDNELVALSQVENIAQQVSIPISDPVKPDFDALDFATAGGKVFFAKNNLYVSSRHDAVTMVFDLQNKFWQPPQDLPVTLGLYGGAIIGHATGLAESYTMFDAKADRVLADGTGSAYRAVARFAYRNHGSRDKLKNFDRYYHELLTSRDLVLTHKAYYDYQGARGLIENTLDASDTVLQFEATEDASLGVNPLGVEPLGGVRTAPLDVVKYRRIKPMQPIDYFEFQSEYSCDVLDSEFQILAHGPNAQESANSPVTITK